MRSTSFAVLGSLALTLTSAADVETMCADYNDNCFECAQAVTATEYVEFKYTACYDQLNIVPPDIRAKCIPFETDNQTHYNQTLKAGEYAHYHWTLTTYHLINDADGASITFEVIPEVGYPQMYTKAQILYGGLPMCQMFETMPGTEGNHSSTWPFPDVNTGARAQGPEVEIRDLEKENTPSSSTYVYPGTVFSEVTWGFNASNHDSDNRPKVHTVTIPHVSYGGYFVSVYAGDGHDARYSIRILAERNIDIEEEVEEYADTHSPQALSGEWFVQQTYCGSHVTEEDCTKHCCEWSTGEDDDFSRRQLLEVGEPAFHRQLQEGGECVQATADHICVSEKDSSDSSTGVPEPTILVSFQTTSDTSRRYQLYYVEMNDCASQMDRNGHEYCWQGGWFTDGGRLEDLLPEGGKYLEANWDATCGLGQGDGDTAYCDPRYSEPGYCNFDGTGSYEGEPEETMWSNAYDCIVWTPLGLEMHGLPANYIEYQDEEGEWQAISEVGSSFDGNVNSLHSEGWNSSLRLKAIVTSYDIRRADASVASGDQGPYYNGWLKLPASTWVTTELAIYNNVSYFFNVLVKESSGDLDCYKGANAKTRFWRQTTLIPVEMIEIIAVVVVVALLALLVPFILTKRKITAHLRDVYESHKYKGYLKGVDERVIEARANRSAAGGGGDGDDDEDVALQKEAKESGGGGDGGGGGGGGGGTKKKKKKKTKKQQIKPVTNSKEPAEESKDAGDATLSANASATL